MKKIWQICCLLIGLTSVSYAQVSHPAPGYPEERAKGLQKQLTLTDAQTTKVAAVYKESAEKFEKIKKAEHGDSDKIKKQSLSLRTATIKKIKGVLTPNQAVKFDGLVKQTKKSGGIDWVDVWSSGSGN
jgi:Spy/CpxP family protein refolding chaperone